MSIESLIRFSASSGNDDKYKHLWVVGAALHVDQMNELLKYTGYKPIVRDVGEFANPQSEELGAVLNNNKSDKACNHNYHVMYSHIINNLGRNKELNVLEIGLGTNNPQMVSTMGSEGRPGASLYSWAEYLPNAKIYGADVDKDILFQTERIKTHYVDQLDMRTFDTMQTAFNTSYDLIIDDGLHSIGANLNTLIFALEHLNVGGWIVIEDIGPIQISNWHVVDYLLKQNRDYECFMMKTARAYIFVVHKLR
jgi:hypothetical protein